MDTSRDEEGRLADALFTVVASRLPWDLEAFDALVRALTAAAPLLEDPRS